MSIHKIGVIGAGMMGAEIALCFEMAGYPTVLADIKREFAENGKKKQETILAKRVAKGRMGQEEMEAVLERVTVTADNRDFHHQAGIRCEKRTGICRYAFQFPGQCHEIG